MSNFVANFRMIYEKRPSVKSIAVKHALTESRIQKIVCESERKFQFSDYLLPISATLSLKRGSAVSPLSKSDRGKRLSSQYKPF